MNDLIFFGGRYIYQDSHERTEYNRICSKHLDAMMRGFLIKMLLMFLSYLAAVVGPIYVYFVYGIKTTTINARVPFVDENSTAEFMVNLVLMSCFAVHGGLWYISVEVYMALFSNVVTLTPDLVRSELNHLAEEWQKRTISRLELTIRIKNAVKQSLDADE